MSPKNRSSLPQLADQKNGMGLALSGGGAKGAYQLGCWRAFVERGISFSAVAGTSIGALNGALICQGDWEMACRLWFELTRQPAGRVNYHNFGRLLAGAAGDLGLLFLPVPNVGWIRAIKYAASLAKFASTYGALGALRKNGLFNITEIHPLLKLHLDIARVRTQSVSLFITACGQPQVTRPLGPARWFYVQEQTEEDAWNLIAASMSIPFFFSPIQVRGEYYSDGGAGYWLPIEPLYEHGVRNMIVISTKTGTAYEPSDFPNANIVFIKPQKSLGRFPVATFRFTERAVKRWMDQGYEDALRALERQGRGLCGWSA